MKLFKIIMLPLAFLLASGSFAQNNIVAKQEIALLEKWQAGEKVSPKSVMTFGLDSCFVSKVIDDVTFARMNGKSYGKDAPISREKLSYLKLLHTNASGEICIGEMVCNSSISGDLLKIFRKLFDGGYPIEKMVLVDNYGGDDLASMRDNNSSAFNFRYIGSSKRLSNHSYGLAVDINPLYNPYIKGSVISPIEGKGYVNRENKLPYMIIKGDLCHRTFLEHGFMWGGSWGSLKDYHHFEKR